MKMKEVTEQTGLTERTVRYYMETPFRKMYKTKL